jgi:hypothetical protein
LALQTSANSFRTRHIQHLPQIGTTNAVASWHQGRANHQTSKNDDLASPDEDKFEKLAVKVDTAAVKVDD